jgi:hypothetical protein
MKKSPMACEDFVRSLPSFRDNELAPTDRIRAQEHLDRCRKCSVYLRVNRIETRIHSAPAHMLLEASETRAMVKRRIDHLKVLRPDCDQNYFLEAAAVLKCDDGGA